MYDDIVLFIQLIDAGGFSLVAKKLKLHQTTISKRIGKLEDSLNLILINRNTRNFQLTDDGQRLYEQFSPLLNVLEESLNNVVNKDNVASKEGKLAIAMSPSLSTIEINNYILDFTLEYPKIMLDIHYVVDSANLLKEHYDVAITLAKPQQETAMIKTIWQLNTILCASPAYVANFGKPVSLEDLEQHKIILPLISMRSSSILEGVHVASNRLVTQKFNRHSIAVNSSANNLNYALTGKCIVPLYDCVAKEYIQEGKLIRVLPEYQALPVNVYMVRPTTYRNKLVDLFADYLCKCLHEMNNERHTSIIGHQNTDRHKPRNFAYQS